MTDVWFLKQCGCFVDISKHACELYGLVNYGELRKKIGPSESIEPQIVGYNESRIFAH